MVSDSEIELIERARRGSHQAFGDLVRLHQRSVRSYLCRYADHAVAIDDLAQEVFLAAYEHLAEFDKDRGTLRTWLIGISRHRALHWLRSRQRRCRREGHSLDAIIVGAVIEAADDGIDSDDDRLTALQHCLSELPEAQEQLLIKRYYDNQPVTTLAADHNKSAPAMRVLLHRLRQLLKKCIDGKVAPA